LLHKQKIMVGIIKYIYGDCMTDEGIAKATDAIAQLHAKAVSMTPNVFCFATASIRGIKNQQAVLDAIQRETGIVTDVLSWEKEAYYDYLALKRMPNLIDALAVDIGGGSIELIHVKEGRLINSASLPTGSLKLYREHVGLIWPRSDEIESMIHAVEGYLDDVDWFAGTGVDDLFSIGGTARAAAKLHRATFLTGKTQDYSYSVADMDRLLTILTDKESHYEVIMKILPDRVYTITPGFIALYVIAKRAGVKRIVLSRYGLREGYLIEKVLERGKL